MRNITVSNNRLDESTGIVEHVLGMKTKKTPWYLPFAPKAKGIIVSFVQNLLSPLTRKEGVRGGQLSAFFQLAAAVVVGVVGIGLLVGSLSLFAEPIGTGRGGNNPPIVNVCAPTVEAIWITEDQHLHQFTVKVTFSSDGWEQFPTDRWTPPYVLKGSGWDYRPGSSSPVWVSYVSDSYWRAYVSKVLGIQTHLTRWVYLDLPSSSGGSSYSFEIEPGGTGGPDRFAYFRGQFYNWYEHWIDIYLCLSDLHPITGKPLNGWVTPYRGHAWIMPHGPNESGGYYVPVHFRRSSSSEWETLGN